MANDREKTCQVKMYGGEPCGRPLYDGDQCICHSENTNKPPGLFQRQLNKIFADEEAEYYDLSHFVFPKKGYTLPREYKKSVMFGYAKFLGDADFFGARFSGDAEFREAQFSGYARFYRAQFSGDANFFEAQFSEDANADFFNTQFLRDAYFRGAWFSGDADFSAARFSRGADADFSATRFSGRVGFSRAGFSGRAEFSWARFSGTATFDKTQFRTVSFGGCEAGEKAQLVFDGEALRKNNEEMFLEEADFTEFTFSNPKSIRFRMVNLSKCRFRETDISEAQFIDVTWAMRPTLIRRLISRVKWVQEWMDKRDILARKAVYDELYPETRTKQEYNLIAQLYRRLQANYINNYQYAEAGDFHIGEQEMMRKAKGKVRQFLCTNMLYRIISYYGESFVLPFFWLAATLLLFPAVFLWDGVKLYADYEWSWSVSDLLLLKADYWNCFWKSLSFCTLNRSDLSEFITEPYQYGIITLEIILVITLVTFFLLALRRQYKRKSF